MFMKIEIEYWLQLTSVDLGFRNNSEQLTKRKTYLGKPNSACNSRGHTRVARLESFKREFALLLGGWPALQEKAELSIIK